MAFQCVKGVYKEDEEGLFTRACSDRTRGEGFRLQESRFTLHITKEEILYCDSSESLGQVAQRNFVWPSLEVFKL